MHNRADAPIDVVYTWVDDSFPGYQELLRRYAGTTHDLNPNRTRDNIDILKFSLRSLCRYVPWVRHVYLVTWRPQVPAWLNTSYPGLTVVHHDQIMPEEILPTFNSFAIFSQLFRIKGLTERFLYVEDDMLFGRPVARAHFEAEDGRIRIFQRIGRTCAADKRHSDRLSPWNACLANTNHLLDKAFGRARRHSVNHVPLLIDRGVWAEMTERWCEEFERTVSSRFRAKYSVVPEYLYPHFLLLTGRGELTPTTETYLRTFYSSLENNRLVTSAARRLIRILRPRTICLNDGFGDLPDPGIVDRTRRFLEELYPEKSPFEA
jgi:hypothetical protein